MSWVNDMVSVMHDTGGSGNNRSLKLAVMTGPKSCKIGNLALEPADLMFAAHLLQKTATQVAGYCPETGALQDQSTYLPALQAGDIVLVYQLSDTKFLVIERMVSA